MEAGSTSLGGRSQSETSDQPEDSLDVSQVTGEQINEHWELFAPWIQRALNQGQGDGLPADELRPDLVAGTRQLWAIHDQDEIRAVAVISVAQAPHIGHKVVVDTLSGDGIDEWIGVLVEALKELQEIMGAHCIEASCRPGLGRYMKRLGWSHKATIMELK